MSVDLPDVFPSPLHELHAPEHEQKCCDGKEDKEISLVMIPITQKSGLNGLKFRCRFHVNLLVILETYRKMLRILDFFSPDSLIFGIYSYK